MNENNIDCTGDVVAGDTIEFKEAVFEGSHRRPRYIGDRWIVAAVMRESYGGKCQQHTFTLRVIESSGVRPLESGTVTRRKGRNVYRNGTFRRRWDDESARRTAQHEKHRRGESARTERMRRQEDNCTRRPRKRLRGLRKADCKSRTL